MARLPRILVAMFAVLLAWPVCATCVRATTTDCPMVAVERTATADHFCCDGAPTSAAPTPADDTPDRCLDCRPAPADLAVDVPLPVVSLVPLPTAAEVVLLDLTSTANAKTPAVRFRPPPPTLLGLHTMLTC